MNYNLLICEECGVDQHDDDTVQLRESGRVLCEACCEREGEIGDAVASIVDDLKLGGSITLRFKLEEMDAEEYEEIVANGD